MSLHLIRRATLALLVGVCATHAFAAGDDAKKTQLARRVIELLKPENLAVGMVQDKGLDALQQARSALISNHVAPEKAAAALKDMQGDVQAFVDQASPVALDAAKKADETVVMPFLLKNFSAEEMQQLVTMLESPVRAKFEQLMPEMRRGLLDKVVTDVGTKMNPYLQKLTESVGTKLRKAVTGQ